MEDALVVLEDATCCRVSFVVAGQIEQGQVEAASALNSRTELPPSEVGLFRRKARIADPALEDVEWVHHVEGDIGAIGAGRRDLDRVSDNLVSLEAVGLGQEVEMSRPALVVAEDRYAGQRWKLVESEARDPRLREARWRV